jgi:flavin-dependent dehydrogenase
MDEAEVALVAAGVSLAVGAGTVAASLVVARLQAKQAVELKREDLRTEYMAETVIRRLLLHGKWRKRSYGAIKEVIGDGFSDMELQKHLVRAGAVRLSKSGDKEFWGLMERNEDQFG